MANIAAYRLGVTHLERRLPVGSFAAAAYGGLQDSAPRAGLLALHARMDGVEPNGWEHPELVQIWFRWADYIVPRCDVGVFTLGALPRDAVARASLEKLADGVLAVLDGQSLRTREVARAMPELRHHMLLRSTSQTGKVHIRWDARTTELVPAEPAEMDAEDARLELARRFLHWLGPATPQQFAKWAGVDRADATTTFDGLRREVCAVTINGREGWMLAADEPALLATPAPAVGARLLPLGDPYLYPNAGLAIERAPVKLATNLTGRLLFDGRIVGAWGRAGAKVTLSTWAAITDDQRAAIESEAGLLATPIGQPMQVRWSS